MGITEDSPAQKPSVTIPHSSSQLGASEKTLDDHQRHHSLKRSQSHDIDSNPEDFGSPGAPLGDSMTVPLSPQSRPCVESSQTLHGDHGSSKHQVVNPDSVKTVVEVDVTSKAENFSSRGDLDIAAESSRQESGQWTRAYN